MQPGQTVLLLRRLLARIRDVMAAEDDALSRLARIVQIIAADMAVQVCSIYARRAGDVLELFATEGLRATAVHRTRLRVGEGLIGEIAARGRPMALADAQSHPSFVYRPETGEEIFHSLMGVPILRGGRVVGVLAVQSVERRHYTDEEIEALQTIAMVLAELVAAGELVSRDELSPAEGTAMLPLRLEGARLSPGLGIGVAVMHRHRYVIRQLVAEDVRREHERLRQAFAEMRCSLDDMLREHEFGVGEHRDVLEAYRMIAEDVGWLRRIGETIDSGLTAEAAVQKINEEIHARINQASESYLRERIQDFDDLAHRLLQHLLGPGTEAAPLPDDDDFVVIARSLGPAQLLDYYRPGLRGVVLAEGSPHSHVAIIARALDIPVIGQAHEALVRIEAGDTIIVNADTGSILVRPGEDLLQIFRTSLADRQAQRNRYSQLRDLPFVTRDGETIEVHTNAGLLLDLKDFEGLGVAGVGLYRTEVPFMVQASLPGVENQRRLYRQVLDRVGGKPVVFRTLDVGGDKILPYWREGADENPAMGWRAMRVARDRPALLRQQLRAFIQAAAGEDLLVMFPMVSEVEEFRYGRKLLEQELERHRTQGRQPPRSVRTGAMLEVPALLYQLDDLLDTVDFLSIGTNDLFQFLFASDRGSYRMAERYDVLSPVMLNILRSVVDRCRASGTPVSLCGEMASRPLDAAALLAVGLRSISVSPPAIGPIKAMIRSLDLSAFAAFVSTLTSAGHRSIRNDLKAFAHDHGIAI